jgi:hypothetical protein
MSDVATGQGERREAMVYLALTMAWWPARAHK